MKIINSNVSWLVFLSLILGNNVWLNAQTISPTSGTACSGCVPAGWTAVAGTPDIANTSKPGWAVVQPGFSWETAPIPNAPFTGHSTFISMGNTPSAGQETVRTTMSGLVAGKPYQLTFSYGYFRVTPDGTASSSINSLLVTIGSTTHIKTPTAYNQWFTETISFTATATTTTLILKPNTTVANDWNMINVSIGAGSLILAPCTQPTSLSCEAGTTITVGNTVTSTTTGGTGGTITWAISPTTGVSSTSGTGSSTGAITFNNTGTYTVSFTSTNSATPTSCSPAATVNCTRTIIVNPSCAAGSTAPPLSANTLSNNCPLTTTVDLNSLHTGAVPGSATLVWFDNNTHTGTALATPTAVSTAGTYYAFYYDMANACYSPASAGVTVSITTCCSAGITAPPLSVNTLSNNCPFTTTVNLNSLHTGTVPSGSTLVWYDNNTHTGTVVASPVAVNTAGTYYAFYYDMNNTCYSPVSIGVTVMINTCPTPCAAGITAPSVN